MEETFALINAPRHKVVGSGGMLRVEMPPESNCPPSKFKLRSSTLGSFHRWIARVFRRRRTVRGRLVHSASTPCLPRETGASAAKLARCVCATSHRLARLGMIGQKKTIKITLVRVSDTRRTHETAVDESTHQRHSSSLLSIADRKLCIAGSMFCRKL